jgi:hypothetical protein
MTLSRRLLLSLSVALTALIFVGGIGLWRLYEAQQRFEYVQNNIIPSIRELDEARIDGDGYLRLDFQYLLSTDGPERVAAQQEMDNLSKIIDQRLATYARDKLSNATDREMLDEDKANIAAYNVATQSFEARIRAGDLDGAKTALANGGALRDAGVNSEVDYLVTPPTRSNSATICAIRTTLHT